MSLPVGVLRLLQVADISQRISPAPGFTFTIDTVQDIADPNGGIDLANTLVATIESTIFRFKPPKDRTWYLAKLSATLTVLPANAQASIQGLTVDDHPLHSAAIAFANAGQQFLLFGNSGGTTMNWIQPTDIDIPSMLPIRQSFGFQVGMTTVGAATGIHMTVLAWVYEIQTITPVKATVTVKPAQTVDESWQ